MQRISDQIDDLVGDVPNAVGDAFDAVIDFEKALRDPAYPTQMLADYDCGDHLHPSDTGYLRMGDIIDLSLFDQD